jgi:16S rRNA (uracil1498-N3)-methyltransferase
VTLPLFIIDMGGFPSDTMAHCADADAGACTGLATSTPGATFKVPAANWRHITGSLRMGAGDELLLSDGCGTVTTARIVDISSARVEVESVCTEEPPTTRLCLVQALAKSGRDEMALEESTQIGVDEVIPWQADRSIVQWKGDKRAKAQAKWQNIALNASEQSRRAFVPQIRDVVDSKGLERFIAQEVEANNIVLVLHQDAALSWDEVEALVSKQAGKSLRISIIVGPEGGIGDGEVERFTRAGARSVVLGRNILRASTAGPVALALLSRIIGRI